MVKSNEFNKVCGIIGHEKFWKDIEYTTLYHTLEVCIEKGTNVFYIGKRGKLDALITKVLTDLKTKHENIKLVKIMNTADTPLFDFDKTYLAINKKGLQIALPPCDIIVCLLRLNTYTTTMYVNKRTNLTLYNTIKNWFI